MRIKIEGYSENINLLTTTNQKLMDIMSTSSAHREGEDLQNYELYIKEILSEVEKINQVNTPLYDLVLTKIGFIRGKSRSQGRQQPIIATS